MEEIGTDRLAPGLRFGSIPNMADNFRALEIEIGTLVMKACALRAIPEVHVRIMGLVAVVEIKVYKEELGTVGLASSSYAKELKERTRALTGKEKVIFEVIEQR